MSSMSFEKIEVDPGNLLHPTFLHCFPDLRRIAECLNGMLKENGFVDQTEFLQNVKGSRFNMAIGILPVKHQKEISHTEVFLSDFEWECLIVLTV